MSESGSDADAGSSSDSASYVAPAARQSTLAALRAQTVQPLINEDGWYGANDNDFQHRFAARRYQFPGNADSQPRALKRADSDVRSMAVVHSRSTTLDSISSNAYPPSFGSCLTASGSSVLTAEADSFLPESYLEEVEGGAFEQRLPNLPCPYSILECTFSSTDLDEWDTHVRFHFKGALPRRCFCPFEGCSWSETASTGQQAWNWRLVHIHLQRIAHRTVVPVDAGHPDVEHLWRKKIITDAERKELRQFGRLGADQAAYLSSSRPERRTTQRASRC
ncbi:hypothetical protein LTR91_007399 [Friedmanniomyces endolithicus]|uniref:Uncharacterized protein n=1 Tax=Friedmanniomyces endolithicus TaxID=329885 RepID=A0AAN6KQL9_9PEZI|nr:hypothetical protein LTR75_004701 [Friedmanniomyces endolithicus]KAK0814877.1 hypothetical protein LTR59_000632 [Friedmanniomyces endolithicus]KAK0820369.1 hypothetical protein LTR38_000278 [Friedmanniomyces endolithicus]KAK0923933.1 hypothetical protein LTR57_006309 [Friedmanniomyces endolithicus]KAK0995208.1 hypothetical protein LTR91_007399 [Friedmanniomyces endolithicus]